MWTTYWTLPPTAILFNYLRSGTLSQIFFQLRDFSWGFRFTVISEVAMGRAGGAQRPVLRVKDPKNTDVRSALVRTSCKNKIIAHTL